MPLTAEQQAEIDSQSNLQIPTKRPVSPGLEAMLFKALPVLDHGFVRVVDYMGDDSSIVQAARVSYGVGTKKVSEDRGLIRYLMRHHHTTPFEMCEIKYHIRLPIFVARQWIRHRTASVNEYSARYSIMDREFYIPEPEVLAAQSKINNQGRGDVLSSEQAAAVIHLLKQDAQQCYDNYETMLKPAEEDGYGLARELARMNLTLNSYSQWYWKINLHNLFHFLQLRIDPHAQYEIRVYAEAMLKTLQAWVPIACEAFEDYRRGAVTFSASMMQVLGKMLNGETVEQDNSGLTKREWTEMMQMLAPYQTK
ncbi:FAD-dependent family (ThyX) (PDB:1KQ4) [Commensalibacter communis]|uniref:Flavin-dependent thymidylate synthase n=1 Tax=Commensalibacter communis TaxID=2972786 RepID=A0A9W4TPN2_9PROT|nr:FAD-dependent thymidylate synthase [Commensalibacter communis]CAI3933814.1 FAD-dependent family (ThyX) (PDB:1KQ4) [Commensalibacter communis]CAI3943495.1 FAD-dependent family (ThyX) (PDB:1KQ4) [Commensalibacter communis]CAI3945012.1 FAD-dependent family (ThyX) (PDB:1KQ4) [Commensalibacter communis]CAI3945889.1 FAD-dependent family (ThyX) (PDB:1KQ4) [Commensalibacter communis]CAI3946082.1 FAD-dependent family (ThyX) (PDB:1KQ4) [Commensalibacter communis]